MTNNKTIEIVPAIMPEDFSALLDLIEIAGEFSGFVNIDIMDGYFVPTKSWPYTKENAVEEVYLRHLPSEPRVGVHIMANSPQEIGVACVGAGADRIIFHIETLRGEKEARECVEALRRAGAEDIGVTLLLETPLEKIGYLLHEELVDFVQVMSIGEIGYQGHALENMAYDRIKELREAYPEIVIAVDGGVNEHTIAPLVQSGANRVYVGSAIMNDPDPKVAYRRLCDLAESI